MAASIAGSIWDRQSLRSDFSTTSGIGHLLHAAEEQQRRSLRIMNNVVLQAEAEAQAQAAAEARRLAREAKLADIDRIREEEQAARVAAAREAEAHRKARMEAAQRDEEAVREAARQKVMMGDERLDKFGEEKAAKAAMNAARASAVEARRQEALRQSQALADARRSMYESKQAQADALMRQREELRALEAEIRAEEEYLRQVARDAAKEKAEHELAERTATLVHRTAAKDGALEQRRREHEQLTRMKQQEAKERHEYIQLKAREAAEQDASERERLRGRLDAKAARCDELAAARAALSEQLARVRHSMALQEASMRSSLDMLRRSGASFVLPPEVSKSLARLRESQALSAQGSVSNMSTPRPGSTRRSVSPPPGALSAHRLAAATSPAARPRSASAFPRAPAYLTHMASPSPAPAAGGVKRAGPGSPRPADYQFTNLHGSVGSAVAMGAPSPSAHARKRVRPMSASAAALLRNSRMGTGVAPSRAAAAKSAGQRPYTTAGPVAAGALARREEELRVVLREEIDKETERQAILAGTADERELSRLNRIFTLEREAAKRRILALSAAVHAAATRAAPSGFAPAATATAATATATVNTVNTSAFKAGGAAPATSNISLVAAGGAASVQRH